ncbi:hypothetical protein NMY22_g14996 [Coprinellus aureogranulatus]|nr:hypothetical protein NMY22_g14996 [Coprinellus aureogranulatus]
MTLELRDTVVAVGLSGPPKMVAAAWYTLASPLKPSTALPTLSQSEINTLFQRAESLHAAETSSFASGSSSKSRGLSDAPSGGAKGEMAFFAKVAGTGTLSDRLSALTLMVQSSPVHNTKALETLKGMAERGKRKGWKGRGTEGDPVCCGLVGRRWSARSQAQVRHVLLSLACR